MYIPSHGPSALLSKVISSPSFSRDFPHFFHFFKVFEYQLLHAAFNYLSYKMYKTFIHSIANISTASTFTLLLKSNICKSHTFKSNIYSLLKSYNKLHLVYVGVICLPFLWYILHFYVKNVC